MHRSCNNNIVSVIPNIINRHGGIITETWAARLNAGRRVKAGKFENRKLPE